MKRNAKKIVKIVGGALAGAAMLGSVFSGAFGAMSLADLPSPFITSDGKFDAYVVVGDSAAAADIAAGMDISAAFAQKAVVSAGTAGGATQTLSGDVFLIDNSGNHLALNETLNSVFGTITETEMPKLLPGGTVSLSSGDYKFDEMVTLGSEGKVVFEKNDNANDKEAKLYLKFPKDKEVYTYKQVYSKPLTSANSSGSLTDLKDSSMYIMGKEYKVSKASVDGNSLTLELMGGSNEDTMNIGDERTYTIDGKEYKVKLNTIGEDNNKNNVAHFTVNDQSFSLTTGNTKKVGDLEFGVKEIVKASSSESKSQVTFYLGADKIVLSDDDVTGSTNPGEYKVGSVQKENMEVQISATHGTNNWKINSIEIKAKAPSDGIYVPVDGKLSEKIGSEAVMLGGMDIVFKGLTEQPTEQVRFYRSSDNKYKLEYTAKGGYKFSDDVFELNGSKVLSKIEYKNESDIDVGDYFILNAGDYSNIYKFVSNSTDKIKIKNMNEGVTIDLYTGSGSSSKSELNFHGRTVKWDYDSSLGKLKVDMDGDEAYTDDTSIEIKTGYGATITFADLDGSKDSGNVTLKTEGYADNSTKSDTLIFNVKKVNDKLNVEYDPHNSDMGQLEPKEDTDWSYGYSGYGAYVEENKANADQKEYKITYPDEQRYATVYVTGKEVKTTAASTTGPVVVQPIDASAGVGKLASEVGTPTKNVILVGGPEANPLVKQLAEAGKTWKTSEYTADAAIIQLVENAFGSNDALVVAGWSAGDTRLAGKIVAARVASNQFSDKLVGEKVVLGTTGATSISGVVFK